MSAHRTNLLEEALPNGALKAAPRSDGKAAYLPLRPFEIATVEVLLEPNLLRAGRL